MGASREHNGSAPKLYIELDLAEDKTAEVDFEAAADAEFEAAAETGRGPGVVRLVSEREVIGGLPAGRAAAWRPRRAWTLGALPPRYRKLAGVAVVLAGLAATIGNALVAQAAQRDAARSSIAVMDAAYSPSADDLSLNLLVDLTDPSPTTVTVTRLQAQQGDLVLTYLGAPMSLARSDQIQVVLSGAYDCSAGALNSAAAQPTGSRPGVLHLTLRTLQGNVTNVDLPLPDGVKLPDHWQVGRTAYCAMLWNN